MNHNFIHRFLSKSVLLLCLILLVAPSVFTENAYAQGSADTMLENESYEDGWIRPVSCLHTETFLKERIGGWDTTETSRAFLNAIQTNNSLGIGKPIKHLIHYNVNDSDPNVLSRTVSGLNNLGLENQLNKTGKAVGFYSDATQKLHGNIEPRSISYPGHENDSSYVYGPSKDPQRFPNVAWTPARGINVIVPKKHNVIPQTARNLANALPEGFISGNSVANIAPKNGIVVVNSMLGNNSLGEIQLESMPDGINFLAVNYALYHKAPMVEVEDLVSYVNTYRSQIKKIIFPLESASNKVSQIAEQLKLAPETIVVPKPYLDHQLSRSDATDASAVILNDLYASKYGSKHNVLDTLYATKQPFQDSGAPSAGWQNDFLSAFSLAVNKPSATQAIVLVKPVNGNNFDNTEPLTDKLSETIRKLAPGNVIISGMHRAISQPLAENRLAQLSRAEKPAWLDTTSKQCRHDNPKLSISKAVLQKGQLELNSEVTYTVTVSNSSESGVANAVKIVDKAVEGLELKSYELDGKTTLISGDKASITIPTIEASGSKTIRLKAKVIRSKSNTSTNLSFIDDPKKFSEQEYPARKEVTQCPSGNNFCSQVSSPQKTPHLKVTKSLSNSADTAVGDTATFNIRVENTGSGVTDEAVTVFDTALQGLEILSPKDIKTGMNIGVLAPNQYKDITVKALITANSKKSSTNLANACFGENCSPKTQCEPTDDTCSSVSFLHAVPELSISKSHLDTEKVVSGQDMKFTITVSNSSDVKATNLVVDDMPVNNISQVTFGKPSVGYIRDSKWFIPTLSAISSAKVDVMARVSDSDSAVENKACVKADYLEQICTSDRHRDNSKVEISKEYIGQVDGKPTYKIAVQNSGTTASRYITLTDNMHISADKPSSYLGEHSFTSVDVGTISQDKKYWHIGNIQPQATYYGYVQVENPVANLDTPAVVENTVSPADNISCTKVGEKHSKECAVSRVGAVRVKKTLLTEKVAPNSKLEFNVEVENSTDAAAHNVEILDIGGRFLQNVKFVDAQLGTISGNKWVINKLEAGSKVSAKIVATTSSDAYINEQALTNTVLVRSDLFFDPSNQKYFDAPVDTNDTTGEYSCAKESKYCWQVTVKDNSNLKIYKSLLEGEEITYDSKFLWELQIYNAGQSPAKNVRVFEVTSPVFKDIKWLNEPYIDELAPGEKYKMLVETTLGNIDEINTSVENQAIVEADNYRPIVKHTESIITSLKPDNATLSMTPVTTETYDNSTQSPPVPNYSNVEGDNTMITAIASADHFEGDNNQNENLLHNFSQVSKQEVRLDYCQENNSVEDDIDRCDIANRGLEKTQANHALANTGVNMKLFIAFIVFFIGAVLYLVALKTGVLKD